VDIKAWRSSTTARSALAQIRHWTMKDSRS